ncbi:hypothetical protein [Cobetia sp. MC34]|uniref:hypothetical protein n=1 Tax=Cobetia sp. MC34 TaxID=2785080 RepID=UPI0032D595A5|nr:hypothetical protein [Cobetia sp. MC34]
MKRSREKSWHHRANSIRRRLLVGCIGLYPTLLIVLAILSPLTKGLSFPLMVLIEVLVLVPVTQLISFPLAGRVVSLMVYKMSGGKKQ